MNLISIQSKSLNYSPKLLEINFQNVSELSKIIFRK